MFTIPYLILSSVVIIVTIFSIIYYYKFNKIKSEVFEKKNKFSLFFDKSKDMIFITNEDLLVISSNSIAKKTFKKKLNTTAHLKDLLIKSSQNKIKQNKDNLEEKKLSLIINNYSDKKIPIELSTVSWKENNEVYYGFTMTNLDKEIIYKKEEKIINKIYKASNYHADQFYFLNGVLNEICEVYNFKQAQVWTKTEKKLNYIVYNSEENNHDITVFELSENNISNSFLDQLFNSPTYRIRKPESLTEFKFLRIKKGVRDIIFIPVVLNDTIPLSFIFFSDEAEINSNMVDSLFTLLNIAGEINHKKIITKKLSEKNILLKLSEKISGSGSWDLNTNSDLFVFSEGFEAIYEFEEYKHEIHFFSRIHIDDLPKIKEKLKQSKIEQISFFAEYRIEFKERIKYIHMRGVPRYDSDSKLNGFYGTITDVTMLKEQQSELEESNLELKALNENLEQFTYIASHDLQEPLRKIRTFGNLLLSKYDDEAPGIEYILRMQNASERMQKLINDLLNFSRVSRGLGEFENINFKELVENVLEDFTLNEETKITLQNLPLNYSANRTQMIQLFQNLISNALKFKKVDVAPIISITSIVIHQNIDSNTEHMDYHKISIQDNGIGFNMEYKDKIFTMFQRLHGKNEYPGTGIGLAICKKICENHGGVIKVESISGKGCTFSIFLPI